MIKEYFRPKSIEEAVELLRDPQKNLAPIGGGTKVSRHQESLSGVVDLQQAGMDFIESVGLNLQVGAATKLEDLLNHPEVDLELKRAIKIESTQNIRNAATLGGWLISSDGRSILSTMLLAMDTVLTWEPESKHVPLGDWLPLRSESFPGVLLRELAWLKGLNLAFEYVARSPKDQPVVITAVAKWGSGRTRVALGGFGDAPIIAMDGMDERGVDIASRDAFAEAEDQWATAHYRRDVAAKLALRCVARINAMKGSEV